MQYLAACITLFALGISGFFQPVPVEPSTPDEAAAQTVKDDKVDLADHYGGLALYTVREQMEADPKGTLKHIADIGYKYLESAGYADGAFYGMSPTAFKNYLAELGLEVISSHYSGITLDNADKAIADSKAAGVKYLVVPIPPMGHFRVSQDGMGMSGDVEEVAQILDALGEKCSAAGLQLLYHNHDFELKENADGIRPLDYFIEHTDPENVKFQLDLYWVTKAGADPVAYFRKAPGRFKSWHVKDMDDQGRFAPVGTGSIDFAHILEYKELSGMEYYFVEQDRTFGQTPFEAIEVSHEALREIGFQ